MKPRAVTAGLLVVCGELLVAANAGEAQTTAAAAETPTSSRCFLLRLSKEPLESSVRGTASAAAALMYTNSSHMQAAAGIAIDELKDLKAVADGWKIRFWQLAPRELRWADW
jgi:hypothetical protein